MLEFMCGLAQGIVWAIAVVSVMIVLPTGVLLAHYLYTHREKKEN